MLRKNFRSSSSFLRILALGIGPAGMVCCATPEIARGQAFTDITTSGSGGVNASGEQTDGPPQLNSTNSFTGINDGTETGSIEGVIAAANDTFSQSSNSLTMTATSSVNWFESNNPDGPWIPNASANASGSVTFEVPSSGVYQFSPTGPGPFATSQQLNQLSDTVSVTGMQGSNQVFNFPFSDGIGPNPLVPPYLFTLSPGVVYTATVSSSAIGDAYQGNPAEPAEIEAELTITAVPEPATLGLLVGGVLLLVRRKR